MRFLHWILSLTGLLTRRRRRRSLLHMPEQLEGRAYLSSFVVTSTEDAPDVDPGDGDASTAAGETTLRAAVQEANASPGPDTIVLPPGLFGLTLTGDDDTTATGDLDVTDELTIVGAGSDETVIDASGIDQAFHLLDGATLDIEGLAIRVSEDTDPVLIEDGQLESTDVVVDSIPDAPATDSTQLPAIDPATISVSSRQTEFLTALYQSRPVPQDDTILFEVRPIIVDQSIRLDAMNSIEGYPEFVSQPELPNERSPELPGSPGDSRPSLLTDTNSGKLETVESPDAKRERVRNALFENRPGAPSPARQTSNEETETIEAEQSRDALSPLLPMKKDGELQVVPNDPEQDRPAPPPLPESKFVPEVSKRPAPGAHVAVAGMLMTVVAPNAWKRTLRRISKWSRLVV